MKPSASSGAFRVSASEARDLSTSWCFAPRSLMFGSSSRARARSSSEALPYLRFNEKTACDHTARASGNSLIARAWLAESLAEVRPCQVSERRPFRAVFK